MSDYTLYHGDCLEYFNQIAPASVDAVICDPPYGTTACKWDSVIPFAPMWEGIKRVVKKHAAIVLFGSQPFTSALVMSNPGMFKYTWVWEKENGTNFFNAPFQPLKAHEDIAVFSPAAASYSPRGVMQYAPQKTGGEPYSIVRRSGKHDFHTPSPNWKTDNTGDRYPRSVLRFSSDEGLHPTQKPLALLEYLVKTYTNEGDTVLDFTFGSGTTGHACGNLGRRFIGIEKDAAYFAFGSERIASAYTPLRSMQVAI